MGPLHAVGGVDAGADECGTDVQPRVPGHARVGAVVGVDVHRKVHAVGPAQLNEPGGHLIVVGPVAVLGADGDLVLGTAEVQAHAAHIHDEQLREVPGQGGPAVTHLLMDGENELGVVFRPQALVAEELEQGEHTGGAALVVDEAGL